MTTRVAKRTWLFRDVPQTLALCAWLGLAVSIVLLFSGGARIAPPPPEVTKPVVDLEAQYSGSIILHRQGDECWQRMLDNRTGHLWDIGVVPCSDAMTPVIPDTTPAVTGADRVRAIGKAFGRQGN